MPVISKQKPRSVVASEPSVESSVWDLVDDIRLLLYGASGTGKTTFWATFPGPISVAICSGGRKPGELRSINTPEYRKKIRPVTINSSDQLRDWLSTQMWSGSASVPATWVLDHVSGLQDLVLKEILGVEELPEQKSWGLATMQQYGQCTMQCKEYLRTMLNLPGNVVIVGQERTFGGREDGLDSELIKPTVGCAVTPSLCGWLNPACDYVLQTFKRPKMSRQETTGENGMKTEINVRQKGIEYCLRCEPHDVFMTKFRLPKGHKLPDAIIDPTYQKLLQVIQG